ncbi:MAG: gliding motility-associated C-terminal domain-containing protein [Bacteroidetes bacterium]|nr:gliding motility-associated C-terminal domain-containing protein [Bacteroidota bacterium]
MNIFTKKYFPVFIFLLAGLNANAQSVGGTLGGAIILCPQNSFSGFLTLTGYTGTPVGWQKTTDGGTTWIDASSDANQPFQFSYYAIQQTTCYRIIVQNGVFPPDTSTIACVDIYPASVGGTISAGGEFCDSLEGDTMHLTGSVGNVLNWEYSTNGISWINVANTTTALPFSTITQTTIYRAIVQNGPGCPTDTSSQAYFIIDSATVAGTISGSDTVCYGANNDSLILSGNVGDVIHWLSSTDSGTTWNILPDTTNIKKYKGLTQTTWYAAVVQNNVCDTDTTYFAIIKVLPPIPVNAGTDTSIMKGQSLTLSGNGTGKPLWSPSASLNNDTLFQPTATPSVTTNYILAVTDSNSCINSDAVLITVIQGTFNGVISNLFTPNGDGINDTWYIQAIQEFPDNEVFVFNIYGNEVFHKKNYANDWKGTYNGSELPDGSYYYILKFNNTSEIFKGSLDIFKNK